MTTENEISIEKTPFSFLYDDIRKEFGEEQGGKIFRDADRIYRKLLQKSDDRGSEAVRDHLKNRLLPPLAYYQALTAAGHGQRKCTGICEKRDAQNGGTEKRQTEKAGADALFL